MGTQLKGLDITHALMHCIKEDGGVDGGHVHPTSYRLFAISFLKTCKICYTSFFWRYLDILVAYLCTKNLQDFRFVFAAECKLTTFWRQPFQYNIRCLLVSPTFNSFQNFSKMFFLSLITVFLIFYHYICDT